MRVHHLGVAVFTLVVAAGSFAGTTSAEGRSTDQVIVQSQRLLQRRPDDPAAYLRLGDAYIQKSRQTGDLSYLTLAEQALRRSLELAPRSAGAARHLAYVFASRHEFREAVAQAEKAIELAPEDSHAYGLLGDALLELGRYDEADQAYRKMLALDESLYSFARRSGMQSLRGNPSGAIADLRRAIDAGRSAGEPAESLAWAQWQLGAEHYAVGDLGSAEGQYLAALQTYPSYYRALAGLGQVRAAQERYEDAVDLYRRALAVIPVPEYAAALGDLYTVLGRIEEAKKSYALVDYIGRLNLLSQTVYSRELASFYADHDIKLDEALAAARSELLVRRDVFGYDALAWALYKAGKPGEALDPMREALRLGTRDAKLFFHAGMIYRALGQRAEARELLARALGINRHFHVLYAAVAERTLQELDTP
jgi:tetratricopeptide (TPR) repeat protein